MILGHIVVAAEGFGQLIKDIEYHFLCSAENRVRLVFFTTRKYGIWSNVVTMRRGEFEEGLVSGKIHVEGRCGYPYWLSDKKTIPYLESARVKKGKETILEKINRRYSCIAKLVENYRDVLSSDSPDDVINKHAAQNTPRQNSSRLRTWFYSYLVFGRDITVLRPQTKNIGRWDRCAYQGKKKLGGVSREGKHAGYNVNEDMKEKIQAGFIRHNSIKLTWSQVYTKVLTATFKCEIRTSSANRRFVIQPSGDPFPSYNQFLYWVRKLNNRDLLQESRIGKHALRSRSGSKGSFSQRLSNVYEKVEFDGYYINERLQGIVEGGSVESFCVVTAVCALSGAILGIGFSERKETQEAYNMALFSMAIRKSVYGQLIGLDIKDDEWPCIGLPPDFITDRGPGSSLRPEDNINWLTSLELTPSYSGQSKATVESSHRRNKKIPGPPRYHQSNLNFIEMVKREVLRAMLSNATSDASMRMTNEMLLEGFMPTPANIYNFYNQRGRTNAVEVPFEDIVPLFLTPHAVKVDREAVWFRELRYSCREFRDLGVFDRAARGGSFELSAYVMTMCVRYIWVELDGTIYKLRFEATVRQDVDASYISLDEALKLEDLKKAGKWVLSEQRPLIAAEFDQRFRNETGKEWHGSVAKPGRPRKDGASRRDEADYARFNKP